MEIQEWDDDYDVDKTGIIFPTITTADIDTIIDNDTKSKALAIKKAKKKEKQKKRRKRARRNKKRDPHPTQYYFNKFIDILGIEFYTFLNGYSINHLLCTDIRDWSGTLSSHSDDTKRWKVFERDVTQRMRKLCHHYRKLYAYYNRTTRKRLNTQTDPHKIVPYRMQREAYDTPLLLFVTYNLNHPTNAKIIRKLKYININTLFDEQLFTKKRFENLHRCLHTKLMIYIYLYSTSPVRRFEHNNTYRVTNLEDESSIRLLPKATPPIEYTAYKLKLEERAQKAIADPHWEPPPLKPFLLNKRHKVEMHEEVHLKMWHENSIDVTGLDEDFVKMRLNRPSYEDIVGKMKGKEDMMGKREEKEMKRTIMDLGSLEKGQADLRYYVEVPKEKPKRPPPLGSIHDLGLLMDLDPFGGIMGMDMFSYDEMGSGGDSASLFKLIIVRKWSDIYKYCAGWKRFNKQLREYFCPNILRIRLLYLFLGSGKATLCGWTYNHRILVFQALRRDLTRS